MKIITLENFNKQSKSNFVDIWDLSNVIDRKCFDHKHEYYYSMCYTISLHKNEIENYIKHSLLNEITDLVIITAKEKAHEHENIFIVRYTILPIEIDGISIFRYISKFKELNIFI